MKTDRELLELAANAAGIGPVIGYAAEAVELMIGPRNNIRYWSPLARDGQALRLAVSLKLQVIIHADWVEILRDGICMTNADSVYSAGCMFETTRRAIVRAAAAIGEAMQ